MDDSTLSTCIPGDNVVDSSELINNELKCLNRLLKSNKISINADTNNKNYLLRNSDIPIIMIDNNKIKETSVSKFFLHTLRQKK